MALRASSESHWAFAEVPIRFEIFKDLVSCSGPFWELISRFFFYKNKISKDFFLITVIANLDKYELHSAEHVKIDLGTSTYTLENGSLSKNGRSNQHYGRGLAILSFYPLYNSLVSSSAISRSFKIYVVSVYFLTWWGATSLKFWKFRFFFAFFDNLYL